MLQMKDSVLSFEVKTTQHWLNYFPACTKHSVRLTR